MSSSPNRIEKVLDRCILDVKAGRKSIEECLNAYPDIRSELEPLLRLAFALEEVPKITASESFKAAAPTRMQNLMKSRNARKGRDLAGKPAFRRLNEAVLGFFEKRQLGSLGRRLSAITLLALVILTIALLTNGIIEASANALPGETFYSTKITLERVQLSFSQTDFEDSFLHMKFASRRINEATQLLDEKRGDTIYIVLDDYVRQIYETMAILLDSESLTNKERAELATRLLHNMTQYEDRIRELLARTPQKDREYIEEILTLSQYELSIVMQAISRAPWGFDSEPASVAAENITATQETAPSQRATKTPVPDPTPTPTSTNVRNPDIKATKTVFPIPHGTPIPWWWLDTSKLPTDVDWKSIWPTVVNQIPPMYLTELPPEFQPPFDIPAGIPTWIPTWLPAPPAWLPSEGTPHPPLPPFP